MSARATIIAGVIGAAATVVVGVGSWTLASRSNAIAEEALQRQVEEQRTRAQAERARADRERARADRLQERMDAASGHYGVNMDRLFATVRRELDRKEGPSQLVPAARALLSARDEFKAVFAEIGVLLNSDFDRLGNELTGSAAVDSARLRQTLEALERSWPAKKSALQIAVKRALEALGLG